jgi:U32 family peptidase
MKKNNCKIELLAPAGNMEKFRAAILFGADAVYLGIPDYSLRARINDFNLRTLKSAIAEAHALNKKAYITLNIFAHNHHFSNLASYIKKLKDYQADALIASDPGILSMIKKNWPKAEIHLSTQANCLNWQSAEFWHKQGVKRIILGREASLKDIKEIHRRLPKLELEYFVHGAMCMAYSGRCFLSKYFLKRSANLGDCAQPCRWNYHITEEKRPESAMELIEDEHGSYILNSKDLCLIEFLPDLIEAGVCSLKIEGRAKSVYYTAMITGIYRKALDIYQSGEKTIIKKEKIAFLKKELDEKIINRGYTCGFLLGDKADQEPDFSHTTPKWEFCGEVLKSSPQNKRFINLIKVHNSIKLGDKLEIISPFYDIIKIRPEEMIDEKSKKKVSEAHGGSGQRIFMESKAYVTPGSIIRRKL